METFQEFGMFFNREFVIVFIDTGWFVEYQEELSDIEKVLNDFSVA